MSCLKSSVGSILSSTDLILSTYHMESLSSMSITIYLYVELKHMDKQPPVPFLWCLTCRLRSGRAQEWWGSPLFWGHNLVVLVFDIHCSAGDDNKSSTRERKLFAAPSASVNNDPYLSNESPDSRVGFCLSFLLDCHLLFFFLFFIFEMSKYQKLMRIMHCLEVMGKCRDRLISEDSEDKKDNIKTQGVKGDGCAFLHAWFPGDDFAMLANLEGHKNVLSTDWLLHFVCFLISCWRKFYHTPICFCPMLIKDAEILLPLWHKSWSRLTRCFLWQGVSGIALPSGSAKLFSRSKDGTVQIWDCHTG